VSPIADALVFGILAPGAIALAVSALARPWRADAGELEVAALAAAGIAAAYLAVHRAIAGELSLAPVDVSGWLPHLVLAAAGAAIAGARAARGASWLLRAAVSAGAAYLLLRPQLDHQLEGAVGAVALAGAAGLLLAYWALLDRAVARASARVGAVLPVIATGACAAGAALSGTLLIGQLVGGVAAALGGVMVLALASPTAPLARAAVAPAAVTGWAAVVYASFYATMGPMVGAELLALPAAVIALQMATARRGRLAEALPVAAAAAVAGAVVATALWTDARATRDGGGDESSSNDYGYR
jgi:hypothetical protein